MTKLHKNLGFLEVFSLAAGAMISSGIFILPGLAYLKAGPAAPIAYLVAGLFVLCGILGIIELATAMPKAGGNYYYIGRSFGPFAGTITGMFSWVALSLKTAFAIFGLSELIYIWTGIPPKLGGIGLTLFFVLLNIFGVKGAALMETVLVFFLLTILSLFVGFSAPSVNIDNFQPFFPHGPQAVIFTAAFGFVAFGGLLKVVAVAEEVKKPGRNLPLGMLAALGVVTVLYVVIVFITVGVLPGDELSTSLNPVAETAKKTLGTPGFFAVTAAAVLAFVTTANAGILAASRYPLALSRDRLLPALFGKVGKRTHTPVPAIILTGLLIVGALQIPLETLVKSASAIIMTTYALANIAVIVLRESRMENYQPTFKIPLYPYLPIAAAFLFLILLFNLGVSSAEIGIGFFTVCSLIYFLYGKKNGGHDYALLHLVRRLVNAHMTENSLDEELKEIVTYREYTAETESLKKLFENAPYKIIEDSLDKESLFREISGTAADTLEYSRDDLIELLHERERQGTTALDENTAVPHIVLSGEDRFNLFIFHCPKGIKYSEEAPALKMIFLLRRIG